MCICLFVRRSKRLLNGIGVVLKLSSFITIFERREELARKVTHAKKTQKSTDLKTKQNAKVSYTTTLTLTTAIILSGLGEAPGSLREVLLTPIRLAGKQLHQG